MQQGKKPQLMQLQLRAVLPQRQVLRLRRLSPEKPGTSRLLLSRFCGAHLRQVLRLLCPPGRPEQSVTGITCKTGFYQSFFFLHPRRRKQTGDLKIPVLEIT